MRVRSHAHRSPRHVLQALIDAYHGGPRRLPADLAALPAASSAHVHRVTVEARLERAVSDRQWAAAAAQFTAMAFDDHAYDAGSVRAGWIDGVPAGAGVSGRCRGPHIRPGVASDRRWS